MNDITHYDISRWIKLWIWRPVGSGASVVHLLPLLGGVMSFLLFAYVGQLHEIYLDYTQLRTRRRRQSVFGSPLFI